MSWSGTSPQGLVFDILVLWIGHLLLRILNGQAGGEVRLDHLQDADDAKQVAARNECLVEVMTSLQSALDTSKFGYSGISCAYSSELIHAQVQVSGQVVVCVRLGHGNC